jgi:outer membrane receptor protein involved in Fe transport
MRNTALIIPLLLLTACADQFVGPRPRGAAPDVPSLADVDPDDIEDIEIVRRPAASAIYAPRPCPAFVIIVPNRDGARQQALGAR